MIIARRLGVSVAIAPATLLLSFGLATHGIARSADRDEEPGDLKPVVSVEQLMENVVKPSYEMVKNDLAAKPADRAAWKKIQSTSIVLGESGNLLLFRRPEDASAKDWNGFAVGLREAGAGLVQAARAQDYAAAKQSYLRMVNACNSCHKKFGDQGEPKIEP